MSTLRNAAIQRTRDALVASIAERYGPQNAFADHDRDLMADAVINALYPEITDAKQMIGVPENSLLITDTRPHVTVYQWVAGLLHELVGEGLATVHVAPVWAIMDEGPLTVVWMP